MGGREHSEGYSFSGSVCASQLMEAPCALIKKENQIFLIYKEIQTGAIAKSYMTIGQEEQEQEKNKMKRRKRRSRKRNQKMRISYFCVRIQRAGEGTRRSG
jgi:hypothetical protein